MVDIWAVNALVIEDLTSNDGMTSPWGTDHFERTRYVVTWLCIGGTGECATLLLSGGDGVNVFWHVRYHPCWSTQQNH